LKPIPSSQSGAPAVP